MQELDNVDWRPPRAPLRQPERFRRLYEQFKILKRIREDYFWKPNFANGERLESAARQMCELLGELTTPKMGRPKKKRRDTARGPCTCAGKNDRLHHHE